MLATVVGGIAAAVVGGIVVALAGRWLATPGNTRRANQIRTEAEILLHLPEGAAKDALSEKVQRDVLSHLDLEANRGYRRLRGWLRGLFLFDAVLAIAVGVGVLIIFRSSLHPDESVGVVVSVGLAVLVATQTVEFWLSRRLGKIRTHAEVKADEEVRAAGTAHLDLSAGQSQAPQPAGAAHLNLSADQYRAKPADEVPKPSK